MSDSTYFNFIVTVAVVWLGFVVVNLLLTLREIRDELRRMNKPEGKQ